MGNPIIKGHYADPDIACFDAERFGHVEGFSTEAGNNREVCIDKLEFDEEGNILPVFATW